ncbi:MAG: signal recognition particle-docking protein FtsY [Desulfobulbus sp.]
MLGWFKKKFGKKEGEEEAFEPELPQEGGPVAEPDEETAADKESFFSISPKQDLAFDLSGGEKSAFSEEEPEPVREREPHEALPSAEPEPVDSGKTREEVIAPADLQPEAGEVICEPAALAAVEEAPLAEPEPATAPEEIENREEPQDPGQGAEEEVPAAAPVEGILEELHGLLPDEADEAERIGLAEEESQPVAISLKEETIFPKETSGDGEVPDTLASEPEQPRGFEREADQAIAVETDEADLIEPVLAEAVFSEDLEPVEEAGETSPLSVKEWEKAEPEEDEKSATGKQEASGPESLWFEGEEEAEDEGRTIVPASPLAEETQEKPASRSLFTRLRDRLGKTRDAFVYRLDRLFLGKKEIDQDLFEQLEEILITADLGVSTTLELIDRARKKVKRDKLSDPQALKNIIHDEILAYIQASDQPAELVMPEEGPFVIMVVGVNGVGKTTTIGKIAAKFVRSGRSVLLVAGDTFRAAAINQLRIWGERVGVEVIAQQPGADPSSVVFDGLEYGVGHAYDVILIDTAGRLHTSVNLMEELKKIKRVIGKKMPGAPHEVMLVLDATTGQNGISQAKMFHEAVGVSGLALTKLDGTAKGGIVANVCREIGIPVRFIGIGEQIDDLRDFEPQEFVDALFAEPDR